MFLDIRNRNYSVFYNTKIGNYSVFQVIASTNVRHMKKPDLWLIAKGRAMFCIVLYRCVL